MDIDRVDEVPGEYWKQHRAAIIESLRHSEGIERQRASYTFVKAAKAGAISTVPAGLEEAAVAAITSGDSTVRINTIGGIAGVLLDEPTDVQLFSNEQLVEIVVNYANAPDRKLRVNSLIALTLASLDRPDRIATVPGAPSNCHAALYKDDLTSKRYASLTLANLGSYSPDAIYSFLGKFRRMLEDDDLVRRDDRLFAGLAYCIGQSIQVYIRHDEYTGQEARTKDMIDPLIAFITDQAHSPHLRAMVLEALTPFAGRWPEEVLGGLLETERQQASSAEELVQAADQPVINEDDPLYEVVGRSQSLLAAEALRTLHGQRSLDDLNEIIESVDLTIENLKLQVEEMILENQDSGAIVFNSPGTDIS